MVYWLLLAGLTTWSIFALRDRPLKEYVQIYFTCTLMANLAQYVAVRVFDFYAYHAWILTDPDRDRVATGILVRLGLDPLLGVLYARYCRQHPILIAAVVSALLGMLERFMVLTGAMFYPGPWHPAFTAASFFGYFLIVWWVSERAHKLPVWLHTYGFSLWICSIPDHWLQGVHGLWEYHIHLIGNVHRDSRIVEGLVIIFVICPMATLVATAPLNHRWLWVGALSVVLIACEGLAWQYGLIRFLYWDIWLSVVRFAAYAALPALYAGWMRRLDEQRGEPPAWDCRSE